MMENEVDILRMEFGDVRLYDWVLRAKGIEQVVTL